LRNPLTKTLSLTIVSSAASLQQAAHAVQKAILGKEGVSAVMFFIGGGVNVKEEAVGRGRGPERGSLIYFGMGVETPVGRGWEQRQEKIDGGKLGGGGTMEVDVFK